MPILHKHLCRAAPLLVALTLAACGGSHHDDDGTPPPPPTVSQPPATAEVPPGASASVSGFIAYLVALLGAAADQLEPVDTSTLVAPVDDHAEPVSVN
ncbi:hypothetical protein GJ697_28515 [Pseudoduganella sp. FT25W]|uniref:Lipoprotein n=1 Tax=Duganella alba TaxID=2666081 RepID=A0A6L5QR02_9BURK|nr:hypothetical protein [Duganella alba]MRX11778.1 hypothetical protein [Duganella alba]MRX20236.1 hypothetical protein [Duganella alba]